MTKQGYLKIKKIVAPQSWAKAFLLKVLEYTFCLAPLCCCSLNRWTVAQCLYTYAVNHDATLASAEVWRVNLFWPMRDQHHELYQPIMTQPHRLINTLQLTVRSPFCCTTGHSSYLLLIPLTPMGVLAPGSAHARPSAQPPIDVSGNFPVHLPTESLFWNFPIFRSK
jgi:hypothetical protein